jgi:hypothetical protein
MKRTSFTSFILTTFLLFNSCDTPLNEYRPKSDDEKQIIALLNNYVDARNKKDLAGIQATFHKDGIYYKGMGGEIKASEIINSDPEWWTSYGGLRLYDPKITINGNAAKLALVTLYGSVGRSEAAYTLVKENDNKETKGDIVVNASSSYTLPK